MRKVLGQTINIKMQYETVLQCLMEDPTVVERILNIIQVKNL